MTKALIKPISILSTFAAFFILVACGPKRDEPTKPTDFPVATAVQPTHDPKHLGSGVWKVGLEVEVGTYTTVVPAKSNGCYWARLRNFLNESSSIIASGLFVAKSKGRLTVKSSDAGIEFVGDCVWNKES